MLGIVCNTQRFVIPANADDRRDRAEGFRRRHMHVVGDIGKHMRRQHQALGIANLEPPHAGREALQKFVMHRVVDDEAVDAGADLPLMQEFSEDGRIDRPVQIGVSQNREGSVAAKLQTDTFDD